ncbi:MAG TPA: hypothetical protein ENO40_07095, partial [Desulfurella acetivorans]|nr:hypothetical protein [Desulfurella acetivorans]
MSWYTFSLTYLGSYTYNPQIISLTLGLNKYLSYNYLNYINPSINGNAKMTPSPNVGSVSVVYQGNGYELSYGFQSAPNNPYYGFNFLPYAKTNERIIFTPLLSFQNSGNYTSQIAFCLNKSGENHIPIYRKDIELGYSPLFQKVIEGDFSLYVSGSLVGNVEMASPVFSSIIAD